MVEIMTDDGHDRDSGDRSTAQNRAGTGKNSKIQESLRELYEDADFDESFVEWVRERSSTRSGNGGMRWIDPKNEGDGDSPCEGAHGGDE